MCGVRGRRAFSITICLLAGEVGGCTAYVSPPKIAPQAADTTALGIRAELPLISMWPGEMRRVELPYVRTRRPRAFVLRGHEWLRFRVNGDAPNFVPKIQGTFTETSTPACFLKVDSLAVPGDTIAAVYTIATQTQPPIFSRWGLRIVIEMPPLVLNGASGPTAATGPVPNPFNPTTTLRYRVDEAGPVVLEIFDVRGTHVATVVDANLRAGRHSAEWDGRDARGNAVGSGVYFARLISPGGTRSFKLTVVK